jgi:hypothetical protein
MYVRFKVAHFKSARKWYMSQSMFDGKSAIDTSFSKYNLSIDSNIKYSMAVSPLIARTNCL